jgi:hypothetical protein
MSIFSIMAVRTYVTPWDPVLVREAQILESDLIGQHGVCAHNDLETAVLQARAGFVGVLGRDHARQVAHLDRPAGEAL